MKDNQLVAFVCWDGWGHSNKKNALKRFKIHAGLHIKGRIHSHCRVHRGLGSFPSDRFETFLDKDTVDRGRICRFCLEAKPSFWNKLRTKLISIPEEKETLAEERAVLPDRTCGCISELRDGDLVTFIGWQYSDYKTRTLATGKIHVGRYNADHKNIRSTCQCHPSYANLYRVGQYKIVNAEKNIWRGCKFCRSVYPHIYKRLREAKEPPDTKYILTYPRRNKDGRLEGGDHVYTGSKEMMEQILKNRPQVLEFINARGDGRIRLFKGFPVDIDFQTRTVVDEVTIKE